MHSSSQMIELNVFVGNGHYNDLWNHIHKFLKDKVNYTFYLVYSIDPQINKSVPTKPAIISYDNI